MSSQTYFKSETTISTHSNKTFKCDLALQIACPFQLYRYALIDKISSTYRFSYRRFKFKSCHVSSPIRYS